MSLNQSSVTRGILYMGNKINRDTGVSTKYYAKTYPVAQMDGPLFIHTIMALPTTLHTKWGSLRLSPIICIQTMVTYITVVWGLLRLAPNICLSRRRELASPSPIFTMSPYLNKLLSMQNLQWRLTSW